MLLGQPRARHAVGGDSRFIVTAMPAGHPVRAPNPGGSSAGWRLGRWCVGGMVLSGLLTALHTGAAWAADNPPTARPSANLPPPTSPPAPAGLLSPAQAAQVQRWERTGRSRPEAVAADIQAQIHSSTSRRWTLELLRLLGHMQALQEQSAGLHPLIARVEALGRNDPSLQAEAERVRLMLQIHLLFMGEEVLTPDEARIQLETWLSRLEPPGDERRLVLLSLAGTLADRRGHFEQAVRYYQESVQLADRLHSWRRSLQRISLSHTLHRAGHLDLALDMNNEALALARAENDAQMQAEGLVVRAILLTGQNRDAEVQAALQSSIEQARRAGSVHDEMLGLANLSDVYLQAGQYPQTCDVLAELTPLLRQHPNTTAEQLAHYNCGLAHIRMHRLDEGMRLIQPTLARLEADVPEASQTLLELATHLEAAGYLHEALRTQRQRHQLANEIYAREQRRATLAAQESFEAERRRHALDKLTQDNQISAELLRQNRLERSVWLLASLVVLLALVVVVLWYRRIRATQRQLLSRQHQLRTESQIDALTGLANRHHVQQRVATGPIEGTLYLIDLDHFKTINDRYGHAGGDAVLVEAAARLRATLRDGDCVARWGGEEFLVLVHQAGPEQADALARRLLNCLASRPVRWADQALTLTGSIGYVLLPLRRLPGTHPATSGGAATATSPAQPDTPLAWDDALQLADAAMYLAKARGRNRACGLHHLPDGDETAPSAVLADLPGAWRDGRVVIQEFQGPRTATGGAA